MTGRFGRAIPGVILGIAVLTAVLAASLQVPAVKGEMRCFVQRSFYPSYEPGPVADGTPIVQAQSETPPVRDKCDAADDPAIWVNTENPEKSLVLGTNKQRGLNVYTLDGQLLASHAVGKINNVDVRALPLANGGSRVFVGASNKGDSRLEMWELTPSNGALSNVLTTPINAKVERETYGFCLYLSPETQTLYAFATDKSGAVEQWALKDVADGRLKPVFKRQLRVQSQPEGCVADDENRRLFVGEEDVGIWVFDAEPDASTAGSLIARTGYGTLGGGVLTADVEGLALYAPPGEGPDAGFLIASSQGNATNAVFDRAPPYAFRGAFQIAFKANKTADTDGLDVTAVNLSGPYSRGLLVVQDGVNSAEDRSRANQNFKFTAWADIEDALGLVQTRRSE